MLGKTLAHYKVLSHLGTGGMGEVYRAQDTKLRRDVALKLLPPEFAADPARMNRFEQEARALAALNHTNISGIFGIEQHGDRRFLVMELAEGEDLSEIIKRGPIPLDDALDIARQICTGLEDAHGRGIVHRDLKPANIKVLPDGTVKILDFGLAKAMTDEPATSSTDIANSPTLMNTMTQPGVLLGTAAYMSPEQARGKSVDWRSDIWAFGCVLYEMLTGSQVYGRPTVTDMLAAIIERDPDFDRLPPNLPPALTQLLRRALTKDLRNRLQAIGDARIVLQEIQDGDAGDAPAAATATASGRSLPWLLAILAAVVVTAAGTWLLKGTPPAPVEKPAGGLLRLTLPLPVEYPLNYVGGSGLGVEFTALDLSEDGSQLVYLTRTDNFRGIVALDLATNEHRPLAGTDNAFLPILSPDGRWVAFLADEKLKRVPFTGGGVEILGPAVDPSDLHWSRDGYIYLIPQQGTLLTRMKPALGSPVETVLEDCDCRMVEDWTGPGKVLLKRDNSYVLLDPDGSESPLDIGGKHVRLLGDRYLLSAQSGRVTATRIDSGGNGPFPAPQTVLTGLRTAPLTGRAHYATSDNGLLAYVAGPPGDVAQLLRRHPDGREEPLPFEARIYGGMDVLPDGSRIAIVVDDASPDNTLEVLNLETGTRQVVGDRTRSSAAIWTADGALCFATLVDSVYSAVEHSIDSVNPPTILFSGPDQLAPYDYSSDNRFLVVGMGGIQDPSLAVWDRQTGSVTQLAEASSGYLWAAAFSPDDRYVAYTQVGEAGSEVYVIPYPPTGKRWLVSAGIGEEPIWNPTKRELVFRRGQGWYRVRYDDSGDFRASAPELMFEERYINIGGMEYRMLDDGSMVFLVSANTEETTDRLDIVVNWDQELARVLGAGGN